MRLEALCRLELAYRGGFHLVRPYGGESGAGWGQGDGVVLGERLAGTVAWSNHPARRGDGAMLPRARGVITTDTGAEVLLDLLGRTVFVEGPGGPVGRQLVAVLLESEDEEYAWLNASFCVGEGSIDPVALTSSIEVFRCVPEP